MNGDLRNRNPGLASEEASPDGVLSGVDPGEIPKTEGGVSEQGICDKCATAFQGRYGEYQMLKWSSDVKGQRKFFTEVLCDPCYAICFESAAAEAFKKDEEEKKKLIQAPPGGLIIPRNPRRRPTK